MLHRPHHKEHSALLKTLAVWGILGIWAGVISGAASALFLHLLRGATTFREHHPGILWLLPLAGIVIALVYGGYGKSVEAGNNLLLERIHNPDDTIPLRMAPLILLSTVVTHLFGGSAGREGTAVQMGGTLAALMHKPLRLSKHDQRLLIMAGISGGFGSVFGTPFAGSVFGLEVLTVGRIGYDGLIPSFVAACVGDLTARSLGIRHQVYGIGALPALTPRVWLLILVVGALCGFASLVFGELTHAVGRLMKDRVRLPWLRTFLGGCAVIGLTYLVGTRDYLGLSLPLIERSFTAEHLFWGAFALKILFTAVTLGTGFKGGEVTPLFCIGATLGSAFAGAFGEPHGFFAAICFVAVFAGAANTPLACILMGIEMFGAQLAVPLGTVCIVSYIVSGHRGIYSAQRVGTAKSHTVAVEEGATLHELHTGAIKLRYFHQSVDCPPDKPTSASTEDKKAN